MSVAKAVYHMNNVLLHFWTPYWHVAGTPLPLMYGFADVRMW